MYVKIVCKIEILWKLDTQTEQILGHNKLFADFICAVSHRDYLNLGLRPK